MAKVPTIKLAKPKDKKDFVIVNASDQEGIAKFKKLGFSEEVAQGENEIDVK